ncbi:MAG: nuclear transport factor 2 family protein [Undibacterium sp.]|nr:nuclear transport factor 2 family protein [Opitutaceae bacterium]
MADPTQATLVQRQLDAYNARDVEVLLATHATDARQFEHPATILATGHSEMRPRFLTRFKEPNLHARLLHRIVAGNTVIDHELITRTFPEGPGTVELVAIYEIRAGLIAEARFITGTKTLKTLF